MARVIPRWYWKGPQAIAENFDHGRNDTIMRIIGARAWLSLPEPVRTRFERVSPATYVGEAETRLSIVGRIFAWALLPFGGPMPVLAGRRKTIVHVGVKDGGMSWARTYRGPAGFSFHVRSIKRLSQDGRLFECCAGGWTMLLDVFADQGSLVFRARSFFWRRGGVSIPLPIWMTPGLAEVRHTELGAGAFRFTLSFDHPWFGRTVWQDGIFHDPQEIPQ
ncbi:MAG: DUF4166 domain-containing protein [Alphaproteobacteria bacterium]